MNGCDSQTFPSHIGNSFISHSDEETQALGEDFAGGVRPGSVVALRGGLGAGKTCFVKGLARGLGITECITSPTYTIISEYQTRFSGPGGPVPLYHIDAYRLNGDEDFENTGAAEYISRGITVIEWSERIPRSVPPGAVTVEIEITGPQSRLFKIG